MILASRALLESGFFAPREMARFEPKKDQAPLLSPLAAFLLDNSAGVTATVADRT